MGPSWKLTNTETYLRRTELLLVKSTILLILLEYHCKYLLFGQQKIEALLAWCIRQQELGLTKQLKI